MFRMNYRNFGSYASVLLNHTVKADMRTGIRWYELRIPKGGAPSIYQQGTYAPTDSMTNPTWRWMGSIAQDKRGDIAAGFSASGAERLPLGALHRSRRGRPAGADDPGRAGRVHGHRPADRGRGPLGRLQRLTVDPSDDCTFWFTQEYLGQDTVVIGTWRTRIVSFKFPGCKK